MNVKIKPKKLCGSISAVSSKSEAHRIIIAAALSHSDTEIIINGISDDISATLDCVQRLGASVVQADGRIIVSPVVKNNSGICLNFRQSGSTARFLIPVAAALYGECEFSGEGRLPERPFAELTAQLRKNGVFVSSDSLPMKTSGILRSGDFTIPGNISSQYITGLMLSLPLLSQTSRIIITSKLESAAYIDITTSILKQFGINIQTEKNGYVINPQQYASPGVVSVGGDWSNAACWVCASGMTGDKIEVTGLDINSPQGDREILDLINKTDIDASQVPDLVPVLAVAAAAKKERTVIHGAKRLRIKESDRLLAVTECINSLGGCALETDDGIIIDGKGRLSGGTADSFNDHRIVMAASIASCICENDVEIIGAEAINKSYPSFFDDFKRLGGVFECTV